MKGQIIKIHAHQLGGPTLTTQIGLENNTYDLKVQFSQLNKVPVDSFRLVHKNNVLKLADSLSNLTNDDNVYILLKLGHICEDVCRDVNTRFYHQPPYHSDPEL